MSRSVFGEGKYRVIYGPSIMSHLVIKVSESKKKKKN